MSRDILAPEQDAPLLVFGGPYSNLQATRAIRAVSERMGIPVSNIICTGDIIAYCGEPVATLELIREWGIRVVKGNCEESFASNAPDCGCGFDEGTTCSLLSVDWYRFAMSKISVEQKVWMGKLPSRLDLTFGGYSIAIIHGGLTQINRFIFPSTPTEEKREELARAQTDIVIGGHSGLPFGQRLGQKAWLNSGVIGMPANDGTGDGWYLILNYVDKSVRASWHRLSFDGQKASDTMLSQGLCGGYQKTLMDGLWPSMDVLPERERNQRGQALAPEQVVLANGPVDENALADKIAE
jgi:predicted phosphodiesterase